MSWSVNMAVIWVHLPGFTLPSVFAKTPLWPSFSLIEVYAATVPCFWLMNIAGARLNWSFLGWSLPLKMTGHSVSIQRFKQVLIEIETKFDNFLEERASYP